MQQSVLTISNFLPQKSRTNRLKNSFGYLATIRLFLIVFSVPHYIHVQLYCEYIHIYSVPHNAFMLSSVCPCCNPQNSNFVLNAIGFLTFSYVLVMIYFHIYSICVRNAFYMCKISTVECFKAAMMRTSPVDLAAKETAAILTEKLESRHQELTDVYCNFDQSGKRGRVRGLLWAGGGYIRGVWIGGGLEGWGASEMFEQICALSGVFLWCHSGRGRSANGCLG